MWEHIENNSMGRKLIRVDVNGGCNASAHFVAFRLLEDVRKLEAISHFWLDAYPPLLAVKYLRSHILMSPFARV